MIRFLTSAFFAIGICCTAQTTIPFTITFQPQYSFANNQVGWVTSAVPGPVRGIVTLPSGCAPNGTCAATSVVITPSAEYGTLAAGNTPTSWAVQAVNSFTVTGGVITNAMFQASNYASWQASITGGQSYDGFSMNTTGAWVNKGTQEQLPFNYAGLVQFSVSPAIGQTLLPLGAELTSGSGWTSTGWTGSYNSFTHTAGNTSALTTTISATAGDFEQITVTISGSTTGSIAVSLGGAAVGSFSGNGIHTVSAAAASDSFSITPTSNFDGTASVSIRQMQGIEFN